MLRGHTLPAYATLEQQPPRRNARLTWRRTSLVACPPPPPPPPFAAGTALEHALVLPPISWTTGLPWDPTYQLFLSYYLFILLPSHVTYNCGYLLRWHACRSSQDGSVVITSQSGVLGDSRAVQRSHHRRQLNITRTWPSVIFSILASITRSRAALTCCSRGTRLPGAPAPSLNNNIIVRPPCPRVRL